MILEYIGKIFYPGNFAESRFDGFAFSKISLIFAAAAMGCFVVLSVAGEMRGALIALAGAGGFVFSYYLYKKTLRPLVSLYVFVGVASLICVYLAFVGEGAISPCNYLLCLAPVFGGLLTQRKSDIWFFVWSELAVYAGATFFLYETQWVSLEAFAFGAVFVLLALSLGYLSAGYCTKRQVLLGAISAKDGRISEMEEEKGHLLWSLEHDLRQLTEGIQRESAMDEEKSKVSRLSREQLALISHMREMNAFFSGRKGLSLEGVSFLEAVEYVHFVFAHVVWEKGVNLSVVCEDGDVLIYADPVGLRAHIFGTLVSRFLVEAKAGDRIEILAAEEGDFVGVVITGPGHLIPKEQHRHAVHLIRSEVDIGISLVSSYLDYFKGEIRWDYLGEGEQGRTQIYLRMMNARRKRLAA